jgi:hypothetical protein
VAKPRRDVGTRATVTWARAVCGECGRESVGRELARISTTEDKGRPERERERESIRVLQDDESSVNIAK